MTPEIEMPIKLLVAMGRFAMRDLTRPNLSGIRVGDGELVATDGSHLVRVETLVDAFDGSSGEPPPFLIPSRAIDAVAAAASAVGGKRVRVSHSNGVVAFDVLDAAGYSVFSIEHASTETNYPPVDQVMVTSRIGDTPPEMLFDPKFFDDIKAVVDALGGGRRGVAIKGWGDALSPVQLETPGARFVLMGMRA